MTLPDFPARHAGSHHDTVSMYCSDGPARPVYQAVRDRLYAIDRWRELNDNIKTDFLLCGPTGEALNRTPEEGDYIRIDLAGPGSPSGGGYDWVVISQIAEETGDLPWAAITVKPSPPPGRDQESVSHFYRGGATNTFVVRRVGQCILAEVHGRNEEPNVEDAAPLLDRLRNEAVALVGKLGFGKVQWKDWTDGMVSVIQANPEGNTGFE